MTDLTPSQWSTTLVGRGGLDFLADAIRTEHEAVERDARSAVEHAIRAGELLIEAKAQVAHGEWLPWLGEHFPATRKTAAAYMRLAANVTRVSHLESVNAALAEIAEPREQDEHEPEPEPDVVDAEVVDEAEPEPEPEPEPMQLSRRERMHREMFGNALRNAYVALGEADDTYKAATSNNPTEDQMQAWLQLAKDSRHLAALISNRLNRRMS